MRRFDNPYVPTSQWSPEFGKLLHLYKQTRPMRVLEIGSQYGGTLWHWLHHAPPGARVVNIDLGLAPSMMPLEMVWQSWCPDDVKLMTVFGASQAPHIRDLVFEFLGSIDFCLIDGDHTLKGVSLDWEMYGQRSKVTAFHDLVRHKPHFGVPELWETLKGKYETDEFWSEPGEQPYGGIGVVYVSGGS